MDPEEHPEPKNREELRAATQIVHSAKFRGEAQERQRKAVLEREAERPKRHKNRFNSSAYR